MIMIVNTLSINGKENMKLLDFDKWKYVNNEMNEYIKIK